MITKNDLKKTLKSYHIKNDNDIKAKYAPKSHTHGVAEINNFPTSLPANGGNADTVGGKSANDFLPTTASCNKNWNWAGQAGQPKWLWGGNDQSNAYVYDPAAFRVANANTVGDVAVEGLARYHKQNGSVNIADTNIKQFYGTCVQGNGSAPTTDWWHIMNIPHQDGNGYGAQLALGYHGSQNLQIRSANGTTWGAWYDVIGNIENLKSSVSSGKTAIATAITGKGVASTGSDSFSDMALKIAKIQSGGETSFEKCFDYTTVTTAGVYAKLQVDGQNNNFNASGTTEMTITTAGRYRLCCTWLSNLTSAYTFTMKIYVNGVLKVTDSQYVRANTSSNITSNRFSCVVGDKVQVHLQTTSQVVANYGHLCKIMN